MSKKINNKTITNPKLKLAEEESIEILPISIEENNTDHDEENEFGVELVSMISMADKKPIKLFENDVLVDRIEHDKDNEVGKSFRSKDLSAKDLSEPEAALTIEDKWIKENDKAEHSSWVKRFLVVGAVIVMAAGICAVINLDKATATKEAREKELNELITLSAKSDAESAQKTINIRESVKGYIEATIIEERAKWCRKPIETLEKMTVFYSDELTFDTHHFEDIIKITELNIKGKDLLLVSVKVNNLSGERLAESQSKELLLEMQNNGTYLVDWEAAISYQPNDWDSFISNRITEPRIFRIQAQQKIDYGPYLYSFSDDKKFQAYRLSIGKQQDKFLIGYTKKDSAIDQAMKSLLVDDNDKKTKKIVSMTLKLKFPNDPQSEQCVEIIEIASESWFLP